MRWKTGDLMFSRNLGLFPVFGDGGVDYDVNTVEEGLNGGQLSIRETGVVERVIVEHKGGPDVLVLDGEEVAGALQNRVFVTSVWMGAGQEVPIPVVCVEQGRWSGGQTFSSARFSAYPTLRAKTAQSVYHSLKTRKTHNAEQQEVWRDVALRLKELRVSSPTMRMSDSFVSQRNELEEYLTSLRTSHFKQSGGKISEEKREDPGALIRDLPVLEGQIGFLAFTQKRILGADIFGNEKILRKFYGKLLMSYALDALLDSREEGGDMDADRALHFLSLAGDWREWESYPAVAKGKEFWYASSRVIGKSLSANGGFLHLSLMPAPDGGKKRKAEKISE
ncbi:MAG: ARPP-1 family domain-containing protein [bacterium JZ-2024 1]